MGVTTIRPKLKLSRDRKGAVSSGTPKPMKNLYPSTEHHFLRAWFFSQAAGNRVA